MTLLQIKQLKQFAILQHFKTKTHQKNKSASDGTQKTSSLATIDNSYQEPSENDLLLQDSPATEVTSQDSDRRIFHKETCEAFLSANMPFNKLTNRKFRNYLRKYTGRKIPDQSTLRRYYVHDLYQNNLMSMRKLAAGKKLWVSLDETTDIEQRYIVCFVFRVLGVYEEKTKCYLANLEILESVNHSTIAGFFNDTLQILWPQNIQYKNVLVSTDAAPYMVKCMKSLQTLYPKMIHVTCKAHALHRVAELVRSEHPLVNKLIAKGKSIFMKAPHIIENV